MDRGGRVAERSRETLRRNLHEAAPALDVPADVIGVISLTATTLVWANIAAGHEPDIDGAITVAHTLLSACESRS
jgi:hypothetical protein